MSANDQPPSAPPSDRPPWQVHPALTEERLQIVDGLIREARHDAVLDHKPSRGDTPLVLGCRAFHWTCHRLAQAAFGPYSSWLSIVDGGKQDEESEELILRPHFVLAIGGVPVRFYRGDPEEVPMRYLRRNHPEVMAQQLALEFCSEPELDDVFRIAIETDKSGEVERTILVQVEKGTGIPHGLGWPIKPLGVRSAVAQFTPKREEEKSLERPTVLRRDRKRKEPEQEPGE